MNHSGNSFYVINQVHTLEELVLSIIVAYGKSYNMHNLVMEHP